MIKRLAKKLFRLREVDQSIFREVVLIVDSQQTALEAQKICLKEVQKNYPKADITVLTFMDRVGYWQNQFPDIEFIVPSQKYFPARYSIAIAMTIQLYRKPKLIILSSLAISVLSVALMFSSGKIVLYNRWQQWWYIRKKRLTEMFTTYYKQKNQSFSLTNIIKRFGLCFIVLEKKDSSLIRQSILFIDNGYAEKEQIEKAVACARENYPYARQSLLLSTQRVDIADKIKDVNLVHTPTFFVKRYAIARHMLRLRHFAYDYIFLLSLDATPIIATTFFNKKQVYLYNKYRQLWLIRPKHLKEYAWSIVLRTIDLFLFIWLLFINLWVLIRRHIIQVLNLKHAKTRSRNVL